MFNCSCCYNIDALCVYQQGDWSLRSWAGFICLHFIWSIMHLLLEYIHRRFYSIPASNSHFEVRCIPCSALSVQKTMKVFLCSVLRCSACSGCPDLVDFPSTRLRHPHYRTRLSTLPHFHTRFPHYHTTLPCYPHFHTWVSLSTTPPYPVRESLFHFPHIVGLVIFENSSFWVFLLKAICRSLSHDQTFWIQTIKWQHCLRLTSLKCW